MFNALRSVQLTKSRSLLRYLSADLHARFALLRHRFATPVWDIGLRHNYAVMRAVFDYAMAGAKVRTGMRQSIPSSSIDSCAGVSETLPDSACGQTKRPDSSRLANRHRP